MSFKSVLDKVGDAIKDVFTNKTAEAIADIAFPEAGTLISGLQKSLATAQSLASSATTTGQSTSQVAALVLTDAQEVFQTYADATGTTVETAQQKAIIAAFINLFASIPAATTTTSTTTVATPVVEKS